MWKNLTLEENKKLKFLMQINIVKFFILFFIVLGSIYTGYENPKIVEIPKSIIKEPKLYFHFALNKIGLRDDILKREDCNLIRRCENNLKKVTNEEKKTTNNDDEFVEFKANSFSVISSKVKSYSGKSASLLMSKNQENESEFEIFTQDGFIIDKKNLKKIDLPLFYYNKQGGGIKSVFLIKDKYFALVSQKKYACLYASLINLKDRKELIKSNCLPNSKDVDFNGLGGAYIKTEDSLILTVGAPEHNAPSIAELAQLNDSIFGKILSIKKESIINYNNKNVEYEIFSLGHRNPQGIVYSNNEIFSLEHGPQGGDELNKIIKGKNYGWPKLSFGTRYNNGVGYSRNLSDKNFEEPIFVFNPAIGPSALNKCPKNLSDYYQNNTCLMALSLRGMSIFIFLLDKENTRVISVENILLKKRLRHFGLDKMGNLYFDEENYFYITADKDGLYKVKFDKFR